MNLLKAAENEIITASLIGTDRAIAKPLDLSGDLRVACAALEPLGAEARLLSLAGLLFQYRRAGALPNTKVRDDTLECKAETWSACTEPAARVVRQVVAGRYRTLLPEALGLMIAARLRLPFEHLPTILDIGVKQSASRDAIRHVIGERGIWLARQNPAWSYTLMARSITADDWATSPTPERLELLKQVVIANVPEAIALLQQTWTKETARDRIAFVGMLGLNLDKCVEPFLEAALDDRAADVRLIATALLTKIPESRLARTALDHARSMLSVTNRLFGGFDLVVNLPKSYDPKWARDGIEKMSWIKDVDDPAWWFIQWVGRVPSEYWSRTIGVAPGELMNMAASSDWADPIRLAWSKGADLSDDCAWKQAVLSYWAQIRDGRTTTTGLFPDINDIGENAETLIVDLMQIDRSPVHDAHIALPSLEQLSRVLSDRFALLVVDSLKERASLQADTRVEVWRCQALLKSLAFRISPSLTEETTSGWPEQSTQWPLWGEAVQEFSSILRLRKDLHKEIV